MDIKDIHYDQIREESSQKSKRKRVEKLDGGNKVRKSKDSEAYRQDKRKGKEESKGEAVFEVKEKAATTETTELNEKVSKIGDLVEAQKHMNGQHIGNITKLREKLGDVSEEKAIKEVRRSAKIDRMHEAYGKESKRKQGTIKEETER